MLNFQSHGSGRTISRFGTSLASWNEFLSVAGNGLATGTLGAAPIVLGTNNINRINILANGFVGIGTAAPAHPLQMVSGAHVTTGGVWTNASSRAELVAMNDRASLSAMDIVAVLTRVTQQQSEQLEKQQKTIDELSAELQAIKAMLTARP